MKWLTVLFALCCGITQAQADNGTCLSNADCMSGQSCYATKAVCPDDNSATCTVGYCGQNVEPKKLTGTQEKLLDSIEARTTCAPADGLAFSLGIPSKDGKYATFVNVWSAPKTKGLSVYNIDGTSRTGSITFGLNLADSASDFEFPKGKLTIKSFEMGVRVIGEVEMTLSNGRTIKQSFNAPWKNDVEVLCN